MFVLSRVRLHCAHALVCFARRAKSVLQSDMVAEVSTPMIRSSVGGAEHFPDHHAWTGNLPVISKALHRMAGGLPGSIAAAASDAGVAQVADSNDYHKWTGNVPPLSKELLSSGAPPVHLLLFYFVFYQS